ncbi:ferredoxin family protein [Bradyrhizobium sp. NP1]|uniref:ferredoxin family protein n=1 Tax=Bradyrhizobium sp. NP1 TaxID=3049772 RepID=UPI0025A67FA8|nr:ferredoxin family protein [Bradyrhizobium sp. NP1]WJR79225.1 ferredoxin family protein [Bradyrhizobium sp. NP1]
MAYVVTEACIKCKYMECTTVCPVDCFYEGTNMLVINQSECIDCGSCEPVCPTEAIIPDVDDTNDRWKDFNEKYAAVWPKIKASQRGEPPADAENWKGVENKLETEFDPTPATR